MSETVATPRKIGISVLFDVVHLELVCGDEYEAQVLYDDILDRLRNGEGLTLSLQQRATPLNKKEGAET